MKLFSKKNKTSKIKTALTQVNSYLVNKIDTLSISYKISGTKIFIPFKSICTVTDKEFSGDVIIEYQPRKKVLEYVDLERKIILISKEKITAEELAHKIFQVIIKNLSPKYLKVIIDVKHSKAHRPVQVWIESNK